MPGAVRIRTDLPYPVRVVDHAWIPLADGTRLAARIWLPEGAGAVPAILEYLPYRKNDGTAVGDHDQMTYFAGHGYAGVRVDIRGSGDSNGILMDEYLRQEQDDALETIAWIASQDWCSGTLGMTGGSWGGFNALQVAARQPEPLRAIMSFYASDDRYADDVHYRGGCLLATEMLQWATCMVAFNAKPPDPRIVGADWRRAWLERLDQTPPYIAAWLAHQRRDAFWQHGSVCEDYRAIRCPVYCVAGWTDGYTDAALRLLEHLDVPCKALIGPWGHNDPVRGVPGPAIGMLQESVRWWDHWLRGADNGIMDEPPLRVYMQDWTPPRPRVEHRAGHWLATGAYPPAPEAHRILYLNGTGARATASPGETRSVRGVQQCGFDSGAWCADGHSDDLAPDQRADDAVSLVFDTAPLDGPLAILGFVETRLRIQVDQALALVAIRVCDVAPDGSSLLVTRGLLNLTHRASHAAVAPLEPERPYDVSFRLDAIAHRFRAAHRIRIAVSPTYFPLAWPSPVPVTLTLHTGEACYVSLPVAPVGEEIAHLPEPEAPPRLETEAVRTDQGRRVITRDLALGRWSLRFDWDMGGLFRIRADGIESEDTATAEYAVVEDDPLSAQVTCHSTARVGRDQWQTAVTADARMSATHDQFHVTTSLEAYEAQRRVFARSWSFAFPRDGV